MDEITVTKDYVAEMIGKSVVTVNRYEKLSDDPLPVFKRGTTRQANAYSPREVCLWAIRQEQAKNAKDKVELIKKDDSYYDLDHERGRLTHHQADKVEIEKRKMLGELLEAEEVSREWEKIILAAKSKILAMPNRYAHRVLGYKDLKEANALFTEMVREVLTEMGEEMPNVPD